MNLPQPTEDEVIQFKALYQERYNVELTDDEAWKTATQTLHFFYLCTYGLMEARRTNIAEGRAADERADPYAIS